MYEPKMGFIYGVHAKFTEPLKAQLMRVKENHKKMEGGYITT